VSGALRWGLKAAWFDVARCRQIWVTVGIWLVLSVGFGVGMTYALYRSAAGDPNADPALVDGLRHTFLLGEFDATAGGLMPFWGAGIALALGASVVGSQYGKRTVTLIYAAGPPRVAVLGGQLLALVGVLVVAATGALGVNALGVTAVSLVQGWPVTAPPLGATAISWAAGVLTAVAYGLVGAALAVATRSEMRALGLGLVWLLGVETVLIKVCESLGWDWLGQLTLGGAASNLAVARGAYPWWPNSLTDQVSAAQGAGAAVVLAVWATLAAASALWLIRTRDI
jgi:hypothetical protein